MPEILDSIRDALFGKTHSSAVGVQLAEMADARQGALYFLANTEFVPYPKQVSLASSLLSGIFGNTVFFEDITTFVVCNRHQNINHWYQFWSGSGQCRLRCRQYGSQAEC